MGISPRAHHSVAVLILTLTLHLSAAYQPNKTISFDTFSPGFDNISFLGKASASQGALQLTPDTNNSDLSFSPVNKSGRVLYKTPFLLWDHSHIASFNTSFLINVFRLETTPAEGLAFLIASDLSAPPPGSYGGYLGLTNATIDGHADNHFVAVELDTFKQSYDPDDNHIGLDLNGVVSNITTSLTPLGIQISPVNTSDYTIWVDYDGAVRHIRVYIAGNPNPKPSSPSLTAPLDLKKYLLPKSYFGFAGSTGTNKELNCIKAWNLTVEDLSRKNRWKLAVPICVPAVVVVAVAVLGFFIRSYLRRRRVAQDDLSVLSSLKSLPGMPREFQFKELKRATGNFDEQNKLGQGGFGVVYKGIIAGDTETTEVAVKKFSRDRVSSQGDFLAELSIINRLRHKHLVPLIGWCHKNGMLLLVYEYMPNGSLDQHLFDGPERPLLRWERRYNIAAGVASALHYLHDEYDQKVVHRDLKASNVMLDAAFNARLGDFGLARALDTDKTSYAEIELSGVPGTMGYIAPECFHTGKATRESDVYGFGAVVLEVTCGRRPRCEIGGFHYLADWVWKLHREGRIVDAVDPRLSGEYVAEEAERLLLLGLACCHPLPKERPKAQAIVQILSGSVPPPKVPPFKPAFVWPSWTPGGDEDEDEEDGEGAASALTSTVVTSSYYASSGGGWTPQFLSREGPMRGGDV